MGMFIRLFQVFLSFCIVVAAHAGDSLPATVTPWSGKKPAHSRLILESAEFAAGGVIRAGVQIKLDEGWWTYWRAPGESGIPPMFDWSGSENLSGDPETIWPVPLRAIAYGENVNVYRKEVVFPIELHAEDPTKPVKLHLKITYGTCRNMCIPAWAEHELTIHPVERQPRIDVANAKLIDSYSGRGPSADPQTVGIVIEEVRASVANGQAILTVRASGVADKRRALLLIEGPDFMRVAEITPKAVDDGRVALRLVVGSTTQFRALKGKRIRITLVHGDRALEQTWVVGTTGSSSTGIGLSPVPSAGERPDP